MESTSGQTVKKNERGMTAAEIGHGMKFGVGRNHLPEENLLGDRIPCSMKDVLIAI